jgi:hypothetical protein
LVLDVEGTDGRERGEDQDFERKSALFSLAVSEVLIVNIWENSVGLYHAANMSLLRTVLDVHFQLVDPNRTSRTVLLFVVRDYVKKTPKENLISVIKEDLKSIWTSLKRQRINYEDVEDAFDIRVEFLPHKILQPVEFEGEVFALRKIFNNPLASNYLFSGGSASSIEAHDFPLFAGNIWEKIESSKELDLPTERELLAQFRCDEILNVLLQITMCKF